MASAPHILYALVARDVNVLAEHQSPEVPFELPTATRLVLQRIPGETNARHTYEFDEDFLFVCIVENGITFLCLCTHKAEMRCVLAFLEDMKSRFMEAFVDQCYTSHAFALNSAFAPVLEERLNFYNFSPQRMYELDKIGQVQKSAQENIEQMQSNIHLVLERGEKIDLLVEKTEALDHTAFTFKRSAKALKFAMLCKRVKTYICICFTVTVFVYMVLAFSCGGLGLSKCTGHHKR